MVIKIVPTKDEGAKVTARAHAIGFEVIGLDPVWGDGANAPGFMVLSRRRSDHTFATHFANVQDGGLYIGHYDMTWLQSLEDYQGRVARYTRHHAGIMDREEAEHVIDMRLNLAAHIINAAQEALGRMLNAGERCDLLADNTGWNRATIDLAVNAWRFANVPPH